MSVVLDHVLFSWGASLVLGANDGQLAAHGQGAVDAIPAVLAHAAAIVTVSPGAAARWQATRSVVGNKADTWSEAQGIRLQLRDKT